MACHLHVGGSVNNNENINGTYALNEREIFINGRPGFQKLEDPNIWIVCSVKGEWILTTEDIALSTCDRALMRSESAVIHPWDTEEWSSYVARETRDGVISRVPYWKEENIRFGFSPNKTVFIRSMALPSYPAPSTLSTLAEDDMFATTITPSASLPPPSASWAETNPSTTSSTPTSTVMWKAAGLATAANATAMGGSVDDAAVLAYQKAIELNASLDEAAALAGEAGGAAVLSGGGGHTEAMQTAISLVFKFNGSQEAKNKAVQSISLNGSILTDCSASCSRIEWKQGRKRHLKKKPESEMHPSGMDPSGMHPSGMHPSGMHPSGMHPGHNRRRYKYPEPERVEEPWCMAIFGYRDGAKKNSGNSTDAAKIELRKQRNKKAYFAGETEARQVIEKGGSVLDAQHAAGEAAGNEIMALGGDMRECARAAANTAVKMRADKEEVAHIAAQAAISACSKGRNTENEMESQGSAGCCRTCITSGNKNADSRRSTLVKLDSIASVAGHAAGLGMLECGGSLQEASKVARISALEGGSTEEEAAVIAAEVAGACMLELGGSAATAGKLTAQAAVDSGVDRATAAAAAGT